MSNAQLKKRLSGANISIQSIETPSDMRKVGGIDKETYAILLQAEAQARSRLSLTRDVGDASGSGKKSKRGKISLVQNSFRKVGGISNHASDEDSSVSIIDLDKDAGDTAGLIFQQGDGFDRPTGIFVSNLEMGSPAEALGLTVGDEVIEVNGVDVTHADVEWTHNLMQVVSIVVLKIRKKSLPNVHLWQFMGVQLPGGSPLHANLSPQQLLPPLSSSSPQSQSMPQQKTLELTMPSGPLIESLPSSMPSSNSGSKSTLFDDLQGIDGPARESILKKPSSSALKGTSNAAPPKRRSVQFNLPPESEDQPEKSSSYRALYSSGKSTLLDKYLDLPPDDDLIADANAQSDPLHSEGEQLVDIIDQLLADVKRGANDDALRTLEPYDVATSSPAQNAKPGQRLSFGRSPSEPIMKVSPEKHVNFPPSFPVLPEHSSDPHNLRSPPLAPSSPQRPDYHHGHIFDFAPIDSHPSDGARHVHFNVPSTQTYPRVGDLSETLGVIYEVTLNKGATGLGLSLAGGSNTTLGALFVNKVIARKAAALDGTVQEGDRILSLQGESTFQMTQPDIVQRIKNLQGDLVHLKCQRIGAIEWNRLQIEAGVSLETSPITPLSSTQPVPVSPLGPTLLDSGLHLHSRTAHQAMLQHPIQQSHSQPHLLPASTSANNKPNLNKKDIDTVLRLFNESKKRGTPQSASLTNDRIKSPQHVSPSGSNILDSSSQNPISVDAPLESLEPYLRQIQDQRQSHAADRRAQAIRENQEALEHEQNAQRIKELAAAEKEKQRAFLAQLEEQRKRLALEDQMRQEVIRSEQDQVAELRKQELSRAQLEREMAIDQAQQLAQEEINSTLGLLTTLRQPSSLPQDNSTTTPSRSKPISKNAETLKSSFLTSPSAGSPERPPLNIYDPSSAPPDPSNLSLIDSTSSSESTPSNSPPNLRHTMPSQKTNFLNSSPHFINNMKVSDQSDNSLGNNNNNNYDQNESIHSESSSAHHLDDSSQDLQIMRITDSSAV